MEISNFIENLKGVFEQTNPELLTSDCKFRNLDEWSSLIALAVIAMVDEEYNVAIKGDDIRNSETVQQLFDIVKSRLNV